MAVINDVRPADAIRQGLVVEGDEDQSNEVEDDGEGLFIPENKPAPRTFGMGALNPGATAFMPTGGFGSNPVPANSIFGRKSSGSPPPPNQPGSTTAFSGFGPQAGSSESQQFSTSFGENVTKPRGSTPPLTTKFGESLATTSFANSLPTAEGAASTTAGTIEQPRQAPSWATSFGQNRPSLEQNNPFGPKQTTHSAPSETRSPFGASNQPQLSGTFFPQPSQPAASTGFSFSKPSTNESSQSQSPFTGFQFAKTNPPPASTTSTTSPSPQIAAPFFTPAPSSSSQQVLPTFSLAPQPNSKLQPVLRNFVTTALS